MNTESVDSYLRDGCGRCERYRTPACKVHRWAEELVALRALLRETELTEEMKWGVPCYTLNSKNVVLLTALNDTCALSFLKGAAIPDEAGLLVRAGPNSRIGRLLKFRSRAEIDGQREAIRELIHRAIEVERAGIQVVSEEPPEPIPEELAQRLQADPALLQAFDALTPGRQRSHILHISSAKQAATRRRRVERCIEKIFAGKGFHDR